MSSLSTKEAPHGFNLDTERLERLVLKIDDASKRGIGIFRKGLKPFLPQWNIPLELEHTPQQRQTKDPLSASKFLWTRLFCDRLSRSDYLMQLARKAWCDPNLKWIYSPEEVVKRSPEEVRNFLAENFKFAIQNGLEKDNGTRYLNNAGRLIAHYDGDPRNLVRYKTVDEARNHLMQFEGIASGLANLFIVELKSREIASPTDPKNTLIKVDRHKGGIPIYGGALTPTNHEIDGSAIVPALEKAYLKIFQEHRLNIEDTDAALWIIGSQVCAKQDYSACIHNCPLASDLCVSRVHCDDNTGRYIVLTAEGKRVETRKGANQPHLFGLERAATFE